MQLELHYITLPLRDMQGKMLMARRRGCLRQVWAAAGWAKGRQQPHGRPGRRLLMIGVPSHGIIPQSPLRDPPTVLTPKRIYIQIYQKKKYFKILQKKTYILKFQKKI